MRIKIIFCHVLLVLVVDSMASPEKISLNFKNTNTRNILQILAEHSNKNVIISEKINSSITVNLKDIIWRDALDVILKMQGLIKYEAASVVVIMRADEIDKNNQTLLQAKVFNLQHVSANKVSKLLKPMGLLSPHGKLGAGEIKNSLVVADIKENVDKIEKIIKKIDLPAKQVSIEARIVSADEKFSRDLGVELGASQGKVFDIEASGLSITNPRNGNFNFKITRFANNAVLDLELAALESEGRGKVISKPKLLTTDRQAAYIESGSEIPYQEKNKEGNTSIAFKKAVLSLKVTPEIAEGNSISLLLELSQDKVGQLLVKGVPTIDTRKINTKVLVQSDETVVLGGIYEWSKSDSVSGVPVLGKIPVIKYLFSKNETKMERKELLIFVTPRILP